MTDQLTRIAGLPGSRPALGAEYNRLEPLPLELDRAGAVARALRKMEAALASRKTSDTINASVDRVVTAMLDRQSNVPVTITVSPTLRADIVELVRESGRRVFDVDITRREAASIPAAGWPPSKRATGKSSELWPSVATVEPQERIQRDSDVRCCAEMRVRVLGDAQ